MVIVFDLDDTLLDTRSFIKSAFDAVASYLSPILRESVDTIRAELLLRFERNESRVFDKYLKEKGVFSRYLVSECVRIYRNHDYKITLFPEAVSCLNRFRSFPLYVVTDGNKLVQKRKFEALGLSRYIKKCLCTYAYGLRHAKPSPYCFLKICIWEKTDPSDIVYIADNPEKDFVGIKPLGFKTVRVLTGRHAGVIVDPSFDAGITVGSLNELTVDLLRTCPVYPKSFIRKLS